MALGIVSASPKVFAYSESKLTCHFVVVVVLVGGKRSEKGQKRLLPVDQR